MRLTDAVTVDKTFRRYRKGITLKDRIERMQQHHKKHSPDRYNQEHENRATEVLEKIQNEINQEDNNSSLSSRKEEILRKPVKETIEYIFQDLRKPTATQKSNLVQELLATLEEKARTQKCATYKFLLACEIALAHKKGTYIIFNTLTVAPGEYYKVFSKTSRAFKEYIRKIDRLVENHRYFGVVEEGAKNGRLHIHVIHFMDTLPKGSDDPNKDKVIPTRRELTGLKALWPYGFSSPIIVRYSPQDAFGKLNWRWPHDLRTNAPYKIASPYKLASYVSKYIVKSYSSKKRDKYLWRIRKSHKLGQQVLKELCSQLKTTTLIIIATTNAMTTKWNNWTIPPIELRLAALREIQTRNQHNPYTTHQLDNTIHNLAKQLQPRHSIARSPRDLTKTIQENSQQSTGFLTTLAINNEASFNEANKEFHQRASEMRQKYFAETTAAYGTTSTRDHLY